MIIAQISDPHITLADGEAEQRYQTAARLRRAVAHLNGLPAPPDLVLVTGDCVDSGGELEYERFRALLRPLRAPVYVVPGNHDDRGLMLRLFGPQGNQALPGFVQYVVEAQAVRLIALDTHLPGRDEGLLTEEQLAWLEARLAEAPTRPTVIFQHHPPFATGLAALDRMGLQSADRLCAVLARHPNVERVLAGHIHCHAQRRLCGTLAVTCPSTAHQVFVDLRHTERLAVIMEPPACLLHVWRDDIGLLTYASPIGDFGPPVEINDEGR